MRPWQHARSSAGKSGTWLGDLPIHEFMDGTKVACPDLRHRIVLHNADLGPELAARAFPGRADARAVALRHVAEDLGFTPTLADWLVGCDPARLPRPLHRRLPLALDGLPGRIARQQGMRDEDGPREVLDLLLLPVRLAGPGALAVLTNGFGPAIARQVVGAPRRVAGRHGGQATFDPAHAAEAVIHWIYGCIPPLHDVAAAVRRPPSIDRQATA